MPLILDAFTLGKIAALQAQGDLAVAEVVAFHFPEPDGTKYYGSTKYDELPNFRDILKYVPNIEPRLIGKKFEDVYLAADISDERVSFNLSDTDGEITRLFRTHGTGVKVEIFYYFPQIDWFVSHWFGYLQAPSEVGTASMPASAASGFRSANLPLPKRIIQLPCQNQFGGTLRTQAEVNRCRCPYNRQLVGGTVGNLNPATGLPFISCGKSEGDCDARLGDHKSNTGFKTAVVAVAIQTHGQTTLATSKGNETNLKNPIRVIYGGPRVVRNLDLLAYRQEHNTAHPDQGFLAALFLVSESLRSMTGCAINNAFVGAAHLNVRLGTERQPATAYAPDVSNFNFSAHFFGRIGPLNPGGYSASNITGQCTAEGVPNIRVYTTPELYTEKYTDLRGWCLLDLYTHWAYGHGIDINRFHIPDWIYLAERDAENVIFTDPNNKVWSAQRNKFSAELQGRSAQEQLGDICKFGRYTMPFQHLGLLRILPLEAEPLEDVPVFTDEGPQQNILRTGMRDAEPNTPRLWVSWVSDDVLINELLFTFEDVTNGNLERPQTFFDENQQLKAGRAAGESSLRALRKTYSALGITNQSHLIRIAWLFYWFGEFDTGGTKNNFKVRMHVTFQSGFPLYQSQVIKIDAAKVRQTSPTPERPQGFTYFRVMSKKRMSDDLGYEVICQAYNQELYEGFEIVGGGTEENSYEAESPANTRTGDAEVVEDEVCSGGEKVIGVGNGTGSLRFNNIIVGASGFYDIYIHYKSAVACSAYVSINGGAAELILFGPTAGAVDFQLYERKRLGNTGPNNINFFHPTAAGPEFDRIVIVQTHIGPFDPVGTGDPGGTVCRAQLGEITYVNGKLMIPVLPCE